MAKRVPSRGSEQFVLRLPDGMRDRIRNEADANGRSMNAEIIHRLEEAYELVDWRRHQESAPDWSDEEIEKHGFSSRDSHADQRRRKVLADVTFTLEDLKRAIEILDRKAK